LHGVLSPLFESTIPGFQFRDKRKAECNKFATTRDAYSQYFF
jgi:hypothetical protein